MVETAQREVGSIGLSHLLAPALLSGEFTSRPTHLDGTPFDMPSPTASLSGSTTPNATVSAYEKLGVFYLGRSYDLANRSLQPDLILYDSKDLMTHAVCVGMTGSGKTGLCLSLLEEAAIDNIPVIAIDPKGDLGNLMLTFPDLNAESFSPWIDADEATRAGQTADEYAKTTADRWKSGLEEWDQTGERIRMFKDSCDVAIYTPGSNSGLPITVLRSFTAPSPKILQDADAFRERVTASVSGLLTLLGIDADPIRSREHILLSNIVSRAWQQGQDLSLPGLIKAVQSPGFDKIGFMDLESIFPEKDRMGLAMLLNNLLASPSFAAWMTGDALDVGKLLMTPTGKPRISIMSIAHLSDTERMFFVTILLNEILAWVRSQPGTSSLRAILYMDEIFGYFPPTANPPSKQPMLTLLKQARAFGLGIVLATQNPVDLDYKGLSNTGTWFIGRLQTERDKARVLDGLEGASTHAGNPFDRSKMDATLSALGKRVFLMHNVHEAQPTVFQTRWCLSYLRGPMTRNHIIKLMAPRKAPVDPSSPAPVAPPVFAAPTPADHASLLSETTPTEPPLIPNAISQRIFTALKPIPSGSHLAYRTGIFGRGKLHYVDTKSKVDLWRDFCLLYMIDDSIVASLWDEASSLPCQTLDFEHTLDPQAHAIDLLPDLLKPTSYTRWNKELKNFLYREKTLHLIFSPEYKEYSDPDQSEADFRQHLVQLHREERDLQIEKLRMKYAPKIDALKDRIRKADEKVAVQKEQASSQSMYTAISFGTSVLGALFGKKVVTASNVSKAGTTIRNASKIGKERGDVSRAEEDRDILIEKLHELEEEFNAETAQYQALTKAEDLPAEDYPIRPRKTDIQVDEVSLAWVPLALTKDGRTELLIDLHE